MRKSIIILGVFAIICFPKNSLSNKRPFSVNALQWLLERKEYVRFDWYIGCYLKQHPDTAILHLLKGLRFYNEALHSRSSIRKRINDKTGGIPRNYPAPIMECFSPRDVFHTHLYNKELLEKAFSSMNTAKLLAPERLDVYFGICHIAAQTNQYAILFQEITLLLNKFGCSPNLLNLILNYISMYGETLESHSIIRLLHVLLQVKPDNPQLEINLSKYYYLSGDLDSAYYFSLKAFKHRPIDREILQNAITLAAIKGDFRQASQIAMKSYEIFTNITDFEQAIIYTLTYDSTLALQLQKRAEKKVSFIDSLSLSQWLFKKFSENNELNPTRKYFSGNLFHLNLPLNTIQYKRDNNKKTYYSNKAGIFYVYAQYDSAAHYNLILLRNIKNNTHLGYSTLYNLAAEYYAAGEFRLSYFRFLDLYKYHNGNKDCAVRYALGVNYEEFGDLASAQEQYVYVMQRSNTYYSKNWNIQRDAQYRFNRIRRKLDYFSY